ncbi:hypothetical protein CROQUDRAFT_721914 [Cronartium quercuum f. sp. fusiforme G11]|uniref:SWR1-complex protein 4 n=1 Tax=Cronartium quercuum f. sp. fusiforme G11 TaxID=708437 RepID=A0A9P6NR28_9BASI|nr:hypothetical protein CROQUDRAFT_721914 [Cronartium quercuum f. sp. fusiforme G11]
MDQDLFALIGGNTSSLPLQTLRRIPHTPKEFEEGTTEHTGVKWNLTELQNPGRKDGLKLKHWTRSDRPLVTPFARYATNCNMYTYSTEEYYHWLRDDDWTKEETDYLFSLLQDYDLRFPVVHDRYSFVGSNRSIEDLKARYFSICQKLIHQRPSSTDESTKRQMILSYNFDKHREMERKKHVQALLDRTHSQILEEDFLYVETRRLEQTSERRARDRDDLMRAIGGVPYQIFNELKPWPEPDPQPIRLANPGGQRIPAGDLVPQTSESSNAALSKRKTTIRNADQSFEDLSLEPGDEHMAADGSTQRTATTANDQQNCIHRFDHSTPHHYPSVMLRSNRITQPKSASATARVAAILAELEVPVLTAVPKPLIMPTRANVESYESLIQAANKLSELKRQVDRVDSELKNLKKKKESSNLQGHIDSEASLTGSELKDSQPPQPTTTNDTATRDSGHLLAVPDSGTSRKTNKRSASVSSADSARGSEGRKKARTA